jgi:dethiobiotin synthetase
MTTSGESGGSDALSGRPGFAVTGITPDECAAVATAMLIALLAHDGENVAAMVPVETGIDDACVAGSRGSLIRWAAGHLDDPRLVTPFAFGADRSALHAADASGTLLHSAAFDRARDALSDGRSIFIAHDAIGPLDPITPSLTMLDLFERWQLPVLIVEPVSRWAMGHVRLVAMACAARGMLVSGILLTGVALRPDFDADAVSALRETLGAMFDCPVLLVPHVQSFHDRGELLAAAISCDLRRVTGGRRAELPTTE